MAEQGDEFGRKTFIKRAGVAFVAGASLLAFKHHKDESSGKSEVKIVRTQTIPQTFETPVSPKEVLLQRSLQAILSADIFSIQRIALEKEFAQKAQTVEEIDKGFWVTQDQKSRELLREKRWKLRQTGEADQTGLKKLPEKLEQWAHEKGIHPESLAWCWEANDEINQTLKALGTEIKDTADFDPNSLRLNSGGLAQLLNLENRGFVNVGEARATTQMPESRRGTLFEVAARLHKSTGLDFEPTNIAGSQETSPGLQNGGAIGGQFRPESALELMDMFGKIGKAFNPLDIRSSIVGGCVLIARDRGAPRPGFVDGNRDREVSGLMNWFGVKPDAIESVLNVNYDYKNQVIKSNASSY